jgi:ABC-2 type transport system permease protein
MKGSVRRIWLLTRREWDQRARTRAFQISTQLPALLRATGDQLDVTVKTRGFADQAAGRVALASGEVSVLLVDRQELVWKAEADQQLRTAVTSAVGVLQRQQAIREIGLEPEQAKRLLQPSELRSSSLKPVTREQTARADLGRIGVVLLFMVIAFYCAFVLTGVVEEKSSRVVEVLLSRVRPTELLAGKIFGIGLVGLAQLAVVVGAGLVALAFSENTLAPKTAPSTLAWIVFWFILGYAFYSVLYATAGSLVSRQEETQSLQLPMTGLLLVAYIFAFVASESPDGAAALIGSLFPATAPMVMIVRIAHGGVPWWQIVLAVALTLAAVYGLVQAAGRVYAGSVLRFGGRVHLREAWRGGERHLI